MRIAKTKNGFRKTEIGVVPTDWSVRPLGSCASFRTGPFGSLLHRADYVEDGIPVINPMHIIDRKLVPTSSMTITESAARRLSPFRLAAGDVVIGRRGEMGRCACVQPANSGWLCGTGSMIVTCFSTLNSDFLQRVLSSHRTIIAIENASVGTTMVNLNTNTLSRLLIQIPPTLAEQEAIAAALSDADGLIESLEKLIAKKRQIKHGTMQELLTGRRRLPGFRGKWETKRLGELASHSKSGIIPVAFPSRQFTHFSLPAFDAGQTPVVEEGRLIGSNKLVVSSNAVLLSKLNPRIPRVWAPSVVPNDSVCSTEFLVLMPRDGIDRAFFALVCRSPAVCIQMELHAIGTTGSHQRINPAQALEISVQVPSTHDEQRAIAAILSDMDAELSGLETKLTKARQVKHGMMQELLTGRTRLI
jgi:type I restriction enzyme S subunit